MEQFKYSQAVDSLWATFRMGAAPLKVPAVYQSRIKKLRDLDRKGFKSADGLPLAFSDELASGHGSEVPLTLFNIFYLGLALELWNGGYKQSDIVYLLRHIRRRLEALFNELLKLNPSEVAKLSLVMHSGVFHPDDNVYLVIDRISFAETVSELPIGPLPEGRPIIFGPVICHGGEKLAEHLFQLPDRRTHLVIELRNLARKLVHHLKETPPRRRGRSS